MFKKNLERPFILFEGDISILSDLGKDLHRLKSMKVKKVEYYNIPAAFDTETTSFFRLKSDPDITISVEQWAVLDPKSQNKYEKAAIMYIWQFGINGWCVLGRTWDSFLMFKDWLVDVLDLDLNRRLIVWVHNLAYDFNYLKMYIEWEDVFATKPYMPLKCVSVDGLVFQCSYRNTNNNLDSVGKDLLTYKVEKATGSLDYSLIRHSSTPLTDEELYYCCQDIKVVMAYIQEQIDYEGKVTKIPLTKTGYVRRDIKEACLKGSDPALARKQRFRYKEQIKPLHLNGPIYSMCRLSTQGGFVHANALYANEKLDNAYGKDIASAYPAEILSSMFPMSNFKHRNIENREQLELFLNNYCCIFTVQFTNIRSIFDFDSYISLSKCHRIEGQSVNNGRVISADMLQTTITNVDFEIISKWYIWDELSIADFYTAIKGYMPKPIIESTLKYYAGKTQLKDVKGRESDYMRSKGMLNSIFGMMLTNIVHPEINLTPEGTWDVTDTDIDEMMNKYNEDPQRVLYYPWGTFITAYVRKNITDAIFECGEDYIYTDTDSVKYFNKDRHEEYFRTYNEKKTAAIDRCLSFYGIDPDRSRPRDPKGKPRQVGIFEDDGYYIHFKTLGAKRYMYEDREGYHITIAGLSKKFGLEYLKEHYPDPFDGFCDQLAVDALHTGKNTHTYIDKPMEGWLIDYQGNREHYSQLSGVHLCPCDFSISLADEYIKLIKALQMVNYHPELL